MHTEDRVQISFFINKNKQSTLTMETHLAEVLVACGHNLNKWVQDKFDECMNMYPNYGRRKIGDLIRRDATVFFVRNADAPDF